MSVTAQRESRQGQFGLVLPKAKGQDRLAEADGKTQHLDTAPAGNRKMPGFMHHDQQSERQGKST